MRYTKDASTCSRCGNTYLYRRKRSFWMKWLGVQKHLRCANCNCRLLMRAESR